MVGTHFIVGLSGTTLSRDEARLYRELRPAGIIIFARNVDGSSTTWPAQLQKLIRSAQDAAERERFFVSIDHEGGRVHRLPAPVTKFPPAVTWGEKSVAKVAQAMARELRALGINLDFAPVLDVLLEPKNKVIGDRSFGDNSDVVSKLGQVFIASMEQEGVLTCGKHFPGHGGTLADSHETMPVYSSSRAQILETTVVPFQEAIAAGLRMIMTAHVLYPELDPSDPATLSEPIITGVLRGQLGFQGVVISDAVEMGALSEKKPKEIVTKALGAGVDILLAAQPEKGDPIDLAMRLAEGAGNAKSGALERSQKRIVSLLQSMPTSGSPSDVTPLGNPEHVRLARAIEELAGKGRGTSTV